MLANSGGLFFNQNNGRTGRADQAEFASSRGVEVMTLLTDLIKSNAVPPPDNTEAIQLFVTGRAAMLIESSANLSYIEQNSSFVVSTGFIPHSPTSERNGVVIGGAALWLIDSGNEAENLAAWDFMQFMVAPEQQITWHQKTGYIPVRIDLYEDEVLEDFWADHPNFRTAFDQLLITQTSLANETPNYAVLGGRAGTFPEIRTLVVDAAMQVLDGNASPQAALESAASEANGQLVNYNAFFQ
jgi:sn-glycerol 3-phosphate transport system substrate-binding protein